MQSTCVILLALAAVVAATAIPRPVQPEQLTKEVKLHQKPKGWYIKPYYHTFVETGKSDVLDGMFCKICKDIIDGAEQFGEQTALDYLSDASKELCDQLPYNNLQKDCYNFFMGIANDLIDLINKNIGGEEACTLMTLC